MLKQDPSCSRASRLPAASPSRPSAASRPSSIHAGRLIADPSRPRRRARPPSPSSTAGSPSVAAGPQSRARRRAADRPFQPHRPARPDRPPRPSLRRSRAATIATRRSTATNIRRCVGVKNARLTLRAGFTTVRDLGSAPQVGFALARGTAGGAVSGPAHHRLRARRLDRRRPWRRQRLPPRGDRGAHRPTTPAPARCSAPSGCASSPGPAPR